MARLRLRERLRGKLTIVSCVAALGAALALILYFIYILALQTGWKRDLQQLELQFSRAYTEGAVLCYDGQEVPADARALNYYLQILNMPGLMATRRETQTAKNPGDEVIRLELPEYTLHYTLSRDGFSICVYWQEGEKLHAYAVNGGVDFSHLKTYFSNLLRNARQES